MFAVLALGLDLLLGWAGQFAFAHIAFFGIGTYATALLNVRLGIPFVVGMPLAALLAGAIGLAHRLSGDAAAHRLSGARDLRVRRGARNGCSTPGTGSPAAPTGCASPRRACFGYRVGTDPTAFPVMAVDPRAGDRRHDVSHHLEVRPRDVRDPRERARRVRVGHRRARHQGLGLRDLRRLCRRRRRHVHAVPVVREPGRVRLPPDRAAALDDRGRRARLDPGRADRRRAARAAARGDAHHDARPADLAGAGLRPDPHPRRDVHAARHLGLHRRRGGAR